MREPSSPPLPTLPDSSGDPMLDALLTLFPGGVLIAHRDGTLVPLSARARAFLEAHGRAATLPGRWRPPGAPTGSPAPPLDWIVARVLLTGEVVRDEEVELADDAGEPRTLGVSAMPLDAADGDPTRALVTFADMTDRDRGRRWEPLARMLSRL